MKEKDIVDFDKMKKHGDWYVDDDGTEFACEICHTHEKAYEKFGGLILKEDVNTPGVKVDLVEEIIHAKSDLTKLTLYVEAIKKEKTTKTIEEICKDYLVMFKIYNEYEEVLLEEHEEITIDGVKAGKVAIFVRGKTDGVYPGMIAYLIPLESKFITTLFI